MDSHNFTYKITKDLFAMKLDYSGDYTGNITGQSWRTMDKVHRNRNLMNVAAKQNYTYSYDHLNRLLSAEYSSADAALRQNGITTRMHPQGAPNQAYDLNGNILKMIRTVNNAPVDLLTYGYAGSNRLEGVRDDVTSLDNRYFAEIAEGPVDYSYDAMGNMLEDKNKGITKISYNHANLPTEIVRDAMASLERNGRMKYYYTAAGQKLMTEVTTDPGLGAVPDASRTRVYLGSMVLKGGAIEFIGTAEGRALTTEKVHENPDGTVTYPSYITPSSLKYRYEYQLKDHLGNLRVACRCGDPVRNNNGRVRTNSSVRELIKIVQQNDYDAWGLSYGSETESQIPENSTHRYQYNGKEKVIDLGIGLYEYGFRWHDPQIGRFIQVDPLANDYTYKSTYDYAENSPIANTDLDGLEANPFNDEDVARIHDSPKGAEQVGHGVLNIVSGVLGTIGATALAPETGGASALLYNITVPQIGLGLAQIIDGLSYQEGSTNELLEKSDNLPGLIAHSLDSPEAEKINSVTGLTTDLLTGGGVKALSPISLIDNLKASNSSKEAAISLVSYAITVNDAVGTINSFGNSESTASRPKSGNGYVQGITLSDKAAKSLISFINGL